MGYYTNIHGQITIDPPIPWGEVRDSAFLRGEDGWLSDPNFSLALRIDEEEVETAEGTLVRRLADAVEPIKDESYKTGGEDCKASLQCILNGWGEGRMFTGRLEGYGEDNDDMWRLYVVDGKAVLERPRIMWSDS